MGDVDLLSLLEDGDVENIPVQEDEDRLALIPCDLAVVPVPRSEGNAECQAGAPRAKAAKVRAPSMSGKVGGGRHGDSNEKALLALHMRHCKSLRTHSCFRDGVSTLLDNSTFTKDGKIISVRAQSTASGVSIVLQPKSMKGNRYQRSVPFCSFLQAAYGQLRRDSHIAICLNVSRSTANLMSTTAAAAYNGQQVSVLARIVTMAQQRAPLSCIRHVKWDETQLLTAINADNSDRRVQSNWQTLVIRERLILCWADGSCLILRLVLPPVILLASAAQDIYYAMRHHPSYAAVHEMTKLIGDLSQNRFEVYESDGASSNHRLIAHMLQKVKERKDMKPYVLHMTCQNHGTQLITVSVLAATEHNILNRLYGLTVYLRQLGHWLRLKQRLRTWLEQNLEFVESHSDHTVANHPATLELVDFIRSTRTVESDPEASRAKASLEAKLQKFLDMFNGNTALQGPCHICGQCPSGAHCRNRDDAVRKSCDTLLDLFMHSIPSVPAPNKWTTLYASLVPGF